MTSELERTLEKLAWQILAESSRFDSTICELEYSFAISKEMRHKIRLGDFTADDIPALIKEIIRYENPNKKTALLKNGSKGQP
ncbi:hypothetical protein [Polynucleobacter nymphae]|uniref:hypothetical protein n=1 Tax=Polynucleobacter nymphae TaxID=2081043 RepID=UPI001C0BF5A3|nr:hypothetical protein [Polynucleobacter nymphae]MBU3606874.1 hypothetical protein [Polynucleobacter nymphae]